MAAIATKHRVGIGPAEVDGMDLTVLASLLGVERSTFDAESAAILQERMKAAQEGRTVSWDE